MRREPCGARQSQAGKPGQYPYWRKSTGTLRLANPLGEELIAMSRCAADPPFTSLTCLQR